MRLYSRKLLSLTTALLAAAVLGACSDDDGDSCDDDPTGPGCTPTGLSAPTNVAAAAAGADGVTVTWSAVTGATGYIVERAASPSTTFEPQGDPVTATTFAQTGLAADVVYSYRVTATDGTNESPASSPATFSLGVVGPKVATLAGAVEASRTLFADTLYTLSGYVKVRNGATLTIQPGTTIVGDPEVAGSSLWILRGSRLVANGEEANPIVFTSGRPVGQRAPGDWGGIVIIGNGVINRTGTVLTEGPQGVSETYSGGNDNADDSGSLRYVRIEFAGYDVSNGAGQELNALSSYAVGSGTTYEYVQTLAGLDDSFEFWGGAVDGRYLISYESGDDHFDWSEGYHGRLQYVIAFQNTRLAPAIFDGAPAGAASSDPEGVEADGCDGAGCTDGFGSRPFSVPVLANFTLVGGGSAITPSSKGDIGMVLRRGTGGYVTNGIIARWPSQGFSLRDQESFDHIAADSMRVVNVLFAENGANHDADGGGNFGTAANFAAANHVAAAGAAGTVLTSLDPANLDWTPLGEAATGAGTLEIPAEVTAGFFGGSVENTTFFGAADPAGPKWWQTWTNYVTE